MDFDFNEDQEDYRTVLGKFLTEKSPLGRTRDLPAAECEVDRDIWRGMAELGCFGMLVPEEQGGGSITAQPLIDLFVVAEEMGRTLQAGPVIPTNIAARAIASAGSDVQREELLPGIIAGETVVSWAIVEEDPWDETGIRMEATRSGEDLVLSGTKPVVESPLSADLLLVTARVDGALTQLLVPTGQEGVRIEQRSSMDLTRRFGTVSFDGIRVPGSAVLGSVGDAEGRVDEQLRIANVLLCAESVAAMDMMLARTVEYSRQRVQFGRTIGSFQAIKHRFADLYMLALASRAAAYYAALKLQEGWSDAAESVAVAKPYVAEAFVRSAHEMIQLHGGIGFTWEHDAHLFLKRAKTNEVLYGDPRWYREKLFGLLERAAV